MPGDFDSDYENNNQIPSFQHLSLQIINPKKKKEYSMVKSSPLKSVHWKYKRWLSRTQVMWNSAIYWTRAWFKRKTRVNIYLPRKTCKEYDGKYRKAREMHLWCYDDSEMGQSTRSKTITKSSISHSPERGPESKRPCTIQNMMAMWKNWLE